MAVELLSKIADGGFADVWLGRDDLDREVAVKIVRPEMANVSDAVAHAKALARTDHANVVRVYNVDKVKEPDSGTLCDCIVMELVRGDTLSSRLLSPTPLSTGEAQTIAYGIIGGLEHIHAQRLVHGDLHEENVMIGNGCVKVIDILYKGTLALLSEASRETKIQRDIRSLVRLLNRILERSVLGDPAVVAFARGLGAGANFAEIRSATAAAFAVATPKTFTLSSPKPLQRHEFDPEMLKRQRDVESLRTLLEAIHLPTMDEFIDDVGQGLISRRVFHFWEGFRAVVSSSTFYIYDPLMRPLVGELYQAWGDCLSFGEHYTPSPNASHYSFSAPGDVFKPDAEKAWTQQQEARRRTDAALRALLERVREEYIEIDVNETSRVAAAEYVEFQREMDKIFGRTSRKVDKGDE